MIDVERLKHDRDYWDEVGAPEDATHYIVPNSQAWSKAGFFVEADDRYIRIGSGGHYRLKEDLHMYSLIPRPTRKQWSGPEDGLPPVGTKCEVQHEQFGWTGATVVAHYGSCAVCAPSGGGFYGYAKDECRPIKSEKERVVEAVIEKMRWTNSVASVLEELYDMGALKMPDKDQ